MLILQDEDPYYFHGSYSFKQELYNLLYRHDTPMSAFGNPDELSLLLGL